MTKLTVRGMASVGLMIAIVTAATFAVKIPSPMSGYVNLGDCFVLLSGWLLGPLWGFVAGGLGSALADVLGGYMLYVPGTFIIKGAMALIAALFVRRHDSRPRRLLGGLAAESAMVLGYFGYAALLLGRGLAAALSIPGNLVQGGVGLAAGMALCEIALRVLKGRRLV